MDPVMERVRAADPVSVEEFAGLADFAALELAPRRRGRRRWLSLPAVGAVIAALVLVPSGAPAANEVLQRAIETMAVPSDQILYAKSHASDTGTDYGERQVWVYGEKQMRWLTDDSEEVFAEGKGTTRWYKGKLENHPEMTMVPTEIFRAGALLEAGKAAKGIEMTETDDAYVLTWREKTGPPHWPKLEMTMWIDKDTHAPLKFSDHSWGRDVENKPFDNTFTEQILEFKTLPATPENLKQLEMTPGR